jgi:TRAP-type mannitol/chloroaromatic compound transport system permease large subunit
MSRWVRVLVGGVVGAVVGAFVGLAIPIFLTWQYEKQHPCGDPTASGGLSFLAIGTIPMGAFLGALLGGVLVVLMRRTNANKASQSIAGKPGSD